MPIWVTECGVSEMILVARLVLDVEIPHQCTTFQAKQPGVFDLINSSIAKYLHEGLVVDNHEEVRAFHGKEARLL